MELVEIVQVAATTTTTTTTRQRRGQQRSKSIKNDVLLEGGRTVHLHLPQQDSTIDGSGVEGSDQAVYHHP